MHSSVIILVAAFLVGGIVTRLLRPTGTAPSADLRLARLERKINRITEHLGIADDDASSVPQSSDGVTALILEGKKINAIKLYREQTGVGLKDAKDAVEQIEARLRTG